MRKVAYLLSTIFICVILFIRCNSNTEPSEFVIFNDYDEGIEYARMNNKLVMLDFSGYGSVSNRKMEAIVWENPKVNKILAENYVIISLMVDDKTKLPEPQEIEINGEIRKIRTIGDKWSYFQRERFGVNTQPYYVLLNHEGKPIGPSYAYNEDVVKYLEFLQIGLDNFKKQSVK